MQWRKFYLLCKTDKQDIGEREVQNDSKSRGTCVHNMVQRNGKLYIGVLHVMIDQCAATQKCHQ